MLQPVTIGTRKIHWSASIVSGPITWPRECTDGDISGDTNHLCQSHLDRSLPCPFAAAHQWNAPYPDPSRCHHEERLVQGRLRAKHHIERDTGGCVLFLGPGSWRRSFSQVGFAFGGRPRSILPAPQGYSPLRGPPLCSWWW